MSEINRIYEINTRLKAGDHEAFVEVYNLYAKVLYHFIKKYVKNQDGIDDMVHDAFLNLWRSREAIKSNYPIQNYLLQIAKNVVFKELRKQINSLEVITAYKYNEENKGGATDVEAALLDREYNQIYDLALNRLPPQRKRIFKLSREEGMTHKEIAQSLQISTNTVKEHMSLALKSMKDYIAKDHDILLKTGIFYLCTLF